MSRRFRDQAPSASSARIAGSQSHRSPAPVPLSSRFARPSSTQHLVPTPGSSIARFRDRPRVTDEIETSYEPAAQSSPPLASRSRFSSSFSRRQELVDDLDDDEDGTRSSIGPQTRHGASTQEDEEDDGLADLEFLETLRGTTAVPTPFKGPDSASSSSESELLTPTVSRKRRRLQNRTDHDLNSIETDVPVGPQHRLEKPAISNTNSCQDKDQLVNASSSSDLDMPSSPVATSRFKLPTKPPTSTSLNHNTTTTGGRIPPRPSFRPTRQHQSSASVAPSHDFPPTFSRSRRRGGRQGKDYLSGGAADTVRNWILGLAATADQQQHQQQQQQQRGRGQRFRDIEKVRIVSELSGRTGTRRDGSEKCVLARDDSGRKWCLIGPEAAGSGMVMVDGRSISSMRGSKDVVLGVRMGWDLDLGLNRMDGQEGEERDGSGTGSGSGSGNEALWKVAVLWDVLDG